MIEFKNIRFKKNGVKRAGARRIRFNKTWRHAMPLWVFSLLLSGHGMADNHVTAIQAPAFYWLSLAFSEGRWQTVSTLKRIDCPKRFKQEPESQRYIDIVAKDAMGSEIYRLRQMHPRWVISEDSGGGWLAQSAVKLRFPHLSGIVNVQINESIDGTVLPITTLDVNQAQVVAANCQPPRFR